MKRLGNDNDNLELKRYKGSPGTENSKDDSRIVSSKLLVQKQDFAKVIGKGGHMISNIRTRFGIELKGLDVDESQRLICIYGKAAQVIDAFDAVSEVLYNSFLSRIQSLQNVPADHFSLHLMIDNEVAGKIIGTKGNIINALRTHSGVVHAKMMKDVQTIGDQQMRSLNVEGSLTAIKRFHFYVVRVLTENFTENFFDDPRGQPMLAPPMMPIPGGMVATNIHGPPQQQQWSNHQMQVTQQQQHQQQQMPLQQQAHSQAPLSLPVIPMASLSMMGVHAEAIRQLMDLRNYLAAYSIDLVLIEAARMQQPHTIPTAVTSSSPNKAAIPQTHSMSGAMPYMSTPATDPTRGYYQSQGNIPSHGGNIPSHGGNNGNSNGMNMSPYSNTGNVYGGRSHGTQHNNNNSNNHSGNSSNNSSKFDNMPKSRDPNYKEIEFTVPREKAGCVIGKGAMMLRNLQKEFGVFLCVEKEEKNGMRTVIVRGDEEESMIRARERIMTMLSDGGGNMSEINSTSNSNYLNGSNEDDVEGERNESNEIES